MDTILLIITYIVAMVVTWVAGYEDLTGLLTGVLGVVIVAEYFSLKKTGLTISKRFSLHKSKKIFATILALLSGILLWHLW